jgi:hypothetical protein
MKNRSSSRRPAAKITRTPDWGGEDHPFETGKAPAGRLLVIRDELEKTYRQPLLWSGQPGQSERKGAAHLLVAERVHRLEA